MNSIEPKPGVMTGGEAGRVMMSAHALCPTEMSHPDRMRWMADYFQRECTSFHRESFYDGYEARAIAAPVEPKPASPAPSPELTWLYTHCKAIGMTCKSDSGKWEHDIALFTTLLKEQAERAASPAGMLTDEQLNDVIIGLKFHKTLSSARNHLRAFVESECRATASPSEAEDSIPVAHAFRVTDDARIVDCPFCLRTLHLIDTVPCDSCKAGPNDEHEAHCRHFRAALASSSADKGKP